VIIVGFLVIFYLLGGFQLNNEPAIDEFSVKSNDEFAELIIPKDALPDGVDLVDISVTRVSENLTENGTWIVYDLEPDGLVFTDEVLFNVTLDSVNDTMPLVFISNGTGISLVNNTRTKVDLENNTQTLSIPLTHFSKIFIRPDQGTFRIELSAPDTLLDEQVNTIASFTLIQSKILLDRTSHGEGFILWEFLEPKCTYKGTWSKPSSIVISPNGNFGGKPSSTQVNVGQTNTVQDNTFKCTKEGKDFLVYLTDITVSMKVISYHSEEDFLSGNGTVQGTFRNQQSMIDKVIFVNCFDSEVELDYKWIYNSENLRIHTEIYVNVKGASGTTGIVTLSGPGTQPMVQPVLIGLSGQTKITFIVYPNGEYTALVEIGELSVEKKITA
jgi:hypothetical protein